MAYLGSVAYQLDASREVWEAPTREPLFLHEGGGLDARMRQESSRSLSSLVGGAIVLAVVLVLLGGLRVALTVQTVSCLEDLSTAESTISKALDTRSELMVERSILSSTDRIQRIATENYGMVYASNVETITLADGGTATAPDADASTTAA